MAESFARTFIAALRQLEEQRDPGAIVALFAPDAQLDNPTHHTPVGGPQGVRHFWEQYRASFGEIHSEFHTVVEGEDAAMLEWTSRGTGANGVPLAYDGVSVLGHRDGRIHRFRAYFDPAELGAKLTHGATHGGAHGG